MALIVSIVFAVIIIWMSQAYMGLRSRLREAEAIIEAQYQSPQTERDWLLFSRLTQYCAKYDKMILMEKECK